MTHRSNSLLRFPAVVALGAAAAGLVEDTYASSETFRGSSTSEAGASSEARIEALTSQVNELRDEVEQLRAAQSDPRLIERREAEIKALVKDMLTDADSRASLLDGGLFALTAGYDGNAFYLESADGNFLMNIGGLLQYRYIGTFRGDESGRPSVSPDDNSEAGFEFRRVELGFTGHIGDPRIGYVLVLATEDGAAGVEQIIAQDVLLTYKATENLTLAGGRYFAPLLREELMGGGGSLAVALSYMNNQLSIGRGEGISAIYEGDSFRAHAFFSDGAGSGGGGGVNSPHGDAAEWALTARGDVKLAGE